MKILSALNELRSLLKFNQNNKEEKIPCKFLSPGMRVRLQITHFAMTGHG